MSKLHGVTKIELYNPNTKIKNVVKSENTFQGAVIAQYLRNLGTNGGILNHIEVKNNQLWQKIVGGIFLFQNAENVGNMYMSAGNSMVGNASYGYANAGDPPELGTFNVAESASGPHSLTQVYDFSTNQANGEIGCVCLTSQVGGLIGYGNRSGKYLKDTSRHITLNHFQDLQPACPLEGADGGRRMLNGNTQYTFDYNTTTHKLIVGKYKCPIVNGSVFDWIRDEIEIDLSSTYQTVLANQIPRVVGNTNGNIILCRPDNFNVAAGATFSYYVYNTSNDTISVETITNSTSHAVNSIGFSVAGNVVSFQNSSNNYYRTAFDKTSGVLIGEIKITDDDMPTGYGIGPEYNWGEFSNGLIAGRQMNLLQGHGVYPKFAIYDPVNDTFLVTNGELESNNRTTAVYHDDLLNAITYGHRYSCYKYNNPLYLATINNLSSPVTKTAAQTMKVTYTLTEA